MVYFDIIFIYSKSRVEYIRHVKEILGRFKDFNMYVNQKNCIFFTTEMEFLGFMVFTNGVSMDKRKIKTVVTWPKPRIYHEMQMFSNFVNFYKRFIFFVLENYQPIYGFIQKNVKKLKMVFSNNPKTRNVRLIHCATRSRKYFFWNILI